MTDNEWRELIKHSSRQVYKLLIDEYGNLVYAIVLNKLKNVAGREDIEDCVSDIFVEVFRNAESYSPENGSLKGYISTIAKHTAIDTYRKIAYRKGITSSIEENEIVLPSQDDTPEKITEKKLYNCHIMEKIKALDEPDSSIIIRQYFYGQTIKEIAQIISMSVSAVQKRSVRAREKLRKILADELKFNGKGDKCEKT